MFDFKLVNIFWFEGENCLMLDRPTWSGFDNQ